MSRVIAVTAAVLAALAAAAPAARADGAGAPKQIGCIAYKGPPAPSPGCVAGRAMYAPSSLRISADGRNAYAATFTDQSVLVFDRGPDGALTQKSGPGGCISVAGGEGCASDGRIGTGIGVALSPDAQNKYVYVTSYQNNAILTFARNNDGTLTLIQCLSSSAIAGCTQDARQLAGANWVEVSPTDGTVYVSATAPAPAGLHALTAFTPQQDGTLVQRVGAAGCVVSGSPPPGCEQRPLIAGLLMLLVTGSEVYVPSSAVGGGAIVVLSPALQQVSCVTAVAFPDCSIYAAIKTPTGLTLSPSGNTLYVAAAARDAILSLRRGAGGALTPLAAGCIAVVADAFCTRTSPALDEVRDVAVSGDGQQVYAVSRVSDALVTFDTAADGTLTQRALPFGCLAVTLAGCTATPGLNLAADVTVSPDDRNVYVNAHVAPHEANGNTVTSYARDRAPACGPVSVGTTVNASVTFKLNCSDPDGDPLSYEILSKPARGIIPDPQADGTITYGPVPGFSGTDTFTYRATAYGVTTAIGTASITVSPTVVVPQPSPTPAPTPAPIVRKPAKLAITVAHNWVVDTGSHKSRVTELTVKHVPSGARVEVRCSGTGCPFKLKVAKAKGGVAKLLPLFKQRRMNAGARIEIRVTKAGSIGRVVVFALRGSVTPKRSDSCLKPGATKPSKC